MLKCPAQVHHIHNRTYAKLENELIYPQSSIRMVSEAVNKNVETHPCGLLSIASDIDFLVELERT